MTSEILQIAAVSENKKFSVYIRPTQTISHHASKINALHYVAGELYFQNKKVDALTLFDALLSFSQFLYLHHVYLSHIMLALTFHELSKQELLPVTT